MLHLQSSRKVCAEVIGDDAPAEVDPDAVLMDLGLDSLGLAELVNQLELVYGEGCISIGDVLGDGSGGVGTLVDQLDLIILELDGDHTAAHAQLYSSWTAKLLSRGFHRIWASQDTMDVYAQWSQRLYSHVWQRAVPLAGASHLPRYNRSSCSETRRRMNYTTAEIRCATSRGF